VFADGDIYKSGFQGQGLYVSPETDTVVVFFSTTYNDLPAYARHCKIGEVEGWNRRPMTNKIKF
jgi:hypothetical protein